MRDVYVRLMGGLGNQMFQYAAARALALRLGTGVTLDLSALAIDGLRRYELGRYPIAATIAESGELARFEPSSGARGLFQRLRRAAFGSPTQYQEPHFHFDDKLSGLKPPVRLDGFWQSERYFARAADLVRSELTPRDPLEPENARVADAIGTVHAISLHVRRGDYVANARTNAYHGVCPPDYYRAAIRYMVERVSAAHLFVFSDDHVWSAENIRADVPVTHVSVNPPDRGFRDLHLMSLCRHHIIANSSFSWWGAWLNPDPGKMVVAPARWFATAEPDTRDLLPPAWTPL